MLQPATVESLGRALEHGPLSRAALERDPCERDGRCQPRDRQSYASSRRANREVLPGAQVRGAHAGPQPAHGGGASELPEVSARVGQDFESDRSPRHERGTDRNIGRGRLPSMLGAHGRQHGDSGNPRATDAARRLGFPHGGDRATASATRRLDRRLWPVPFAGVVPRGPARRLR